MVFVHREIFLQSLEIISFPSDKPFIKEMIKTYFNSLLTKHMVASFAVLSIDTSECITNMNEQLSQSSTIDTNQAKMPVVKNFDMFLFESKSCLDILAKIINNLYFDEFTTELDCYSDKKFFGAIYQNMTDTRYIPYKLKHNGRGNPIWEYLNQKTQEDWFGRYTKFRNTIAHSVTVEMLNVSSTASSLNFEVSNLPEDPSIFPYTLSLDNQEDYCNTTWNKIEALINETFRLLISEIQTQAPNYPLV